MRYYVTADVHGYFSELKTALTQIGFFDDNEPHKLIICGNIYDRGSEPLQLQGFILELLSKDEIILIKGNHDDLALELLHNWTKESYLQYFHRTNGTIDTVCRLTGFTVKDMYSDPEEVRKAFRQNDYIQKIIPSMLDYFETEHYIFTHGWIPCTPIRITSDKNEYVMIEDWRNAESKAWDKARWINGMEAAHSGVIENNKTIVCGHWHCSFGHSRYENDGGEFDNNPNFNPYYAKGIIALDACTPVSKKVNCIIIED